MDSFLIYGDTKSLEEYKASALGYQQTSKQLHDVITDPDQLQLLVGLDLLGQEYTVLADQMIDFKKDNKTEKYMEIGSTKVKDIIQKFIAASDELVKEQQDLLDESYAKTATEVKMVKIIVFSITIIALLAGIFIAYFISRLISKPVLALSAAAEKIASGDLSETELVVTSKDEIGKLAASFHLMTRNLCHLIQEVADHAKQVAHAADELSQSAEQSGKATEQVAHISEEVAVGSDEQLKNIQESVEFVHNMSDESESIAESAETVSNRAIQTSQLTTEGHEAVRTAIEQMNEINQTVNEIAEVVKVLGARSVEIGQIVGFMTNIASQTNLLALNAAIEAARAGEAGKGFSVVASEVGKLAEQSSQSGQKIAKLVATIQAETLKTVETVENGTKVVEAGIQAVKIAGSSFENIQDSIRDVSSQIQAVSNAAKQMSAGTSNLVSLFEAISKVSDSNALGTQNVLAATEESYWQPWNKLMDLQTRCPRCRTICLR